MKAAGEDDRDHRIAGAMNLEDRRPDLPGGPYPTLPSSLSSTCCAGSTPGIVVEGGFMFIRRGSLARIIAAIMLVVFAGCAPAKWQLVSGMGGDTKPGTTKRCELVPKVSPRSLVIGHKRIPDEPELGYVYFLFRAPELI